MWTNKLNNIYVLIFTTLIISISIFSCNKKEKQLNETTAIKEDVQSVAGETPTEEIKDETRGFLTLEKWVDYYKNRVEGFDLADFKKDESTYFEKHHSHVAPIWNKDFNPIHKKFLIYNSDSTVYIDFDSHKWGLDDENQLVIEPEQEVTLVNLLEKKVERLRFYGPSFWVEDAYFKNDSILVLLENSTDQIPAYQELNINTNKGTYYTYKNSTGFDSDYYKDRVLSIYKKKP